MLICHKTQTKIKANCVSGYMCVNPCIYLKELQTVCPDTLVWALITFINRSSFIKINIWLDYFFLFTFWIIDSFLHLCRGVRFWFVYLVLATNIWVMRFYKVCSHWNKKNAGIHAAASLRLTRSKSTSLHLLIGLGSRAC